MTMTIRFASVPAMACTPFVSFQDVAEHVGGGVRVSRSDAGHRLSGSDGVRGGAPAASTAAPDPFIQTRRAG